MNGIDLETFYVFAPSSSDISIGLTLAGYNERSLGLSFLDWVNLKLPENTSWSKISAKVNEDGYVASKEIDGVEIDLNNGACTLTRLKTYKKGELPGKNDITDTKNVSNIHMFLLMNSKNNCCLGGNT